MCKVYLDGELVEADIINTKKHYFLGMFRPPINPMENPTTDILCSCGEILKYKGQEIEHYKKGCYDIPQYASIKK